MEPCARSLARHFAFGDQITWIASEAIGEQQEFTVGDALLPLLDRLNLVRSEGAAEPTCVKAGFFDRPDELARRPAIFVATSSYGEPVEPNEFEFVGVRGGHRLAGQRVLLEDRRV